MNILLLSPLPPPEGGIATWTKKYKKYCEEHNISLSIVNIGLIGKRLKKINDGRNYFDEIKRTVRILRDLKVQLKSCNPDIVHMNSSCSRFGIIRDALCVKIIKGFKIPMVFHCRCNIGDQVQTNVSRHMFKYIARNVNAVLVLNTTSYNYAVRLAKNKTIKVPNFIESEYLNSSYCIRENMKCVIFVGHVQRTKGCYEILSAARELPDLEFVLMGSIAKEMENEDIPANVKMLGGKSHNEVKEYLENADIFLFPSYTEGFSNALVEAMATGLPIVTTDVGANFDMIEGYGGMIVPVGDYQTIVDAINEMRPCSIRQSMSEWNREKVQKEYLIDSVMCKLLSIYERACSNRDKIAN